MLLLTEKLPHNNTQLNALCHTGVKYSLLRSSSSCSPNEISDDKLKRTSESLVCLGRLITPGHYNHLSCQIAMYIPSAHESAGLKAGADAAENHQQISSLYGPPQCAPKPIPGIPKRLI